MTRSAPLVDAENVRTDIERTASFGAVRTEEGRGRTALPGDEANRKARDYFVERLERTGLNVRVDAVGNIAGRWIPKGTNPDAAPVVAGSHLDSVPHGGIYDGLLGVYAALEAVRAIRESGITPERPLEVVSFSGEEGTRFADGVLGSTVATGGHGVDAALSLTDGDETLEDALDAIGYRGTGRLDATSWDTWLELHIDQSTRLKDENVPVGVVTDITGTSRGHVTIEGGADHSGTTGMAERQDALAAASEVILEIERCAAETATSGSETAVGTVGQVDVEPNAVNVVPGTVSFAFDIRSVEKEEIQTQITALERALETVEAERGVSTTLEHTYDIPPTPLPGRCRRVAVEAARECGIKTTSVHSGAGHDTMRVADVTDAALLFVASENGHSHSPRERASWADCADATAVLTETIAQLATEREKNTQRVKTTYDRDPA